MLSPGRKREGPFGLRGCGFLSCAHETQPTLEGCTAVEMVETTAPWQDLMLVVVLCGSISTDRAYFGIDVNDRPKLRPLTTVLWSDATAHVA